MPTKSPVQPNSRLAEVRYDIRGPLSRRARELEAQGRPILRLNIGNPGAFGFRTPALLREAVARNLSRSEAYCQEQGLLEARAAVADRQRARGVDSAQPGRVFVGNGVSELIDLSLRALLEPGDEVLIPAPDYPLWSAATRLNGGRPVHYDCPAERGHLPDIEAIAALVTPRTRALVVISPNNPTGAVYPRELLAALADLAARHDLVLLSDEIYDGIVYDGAHFEPLAPLAGDAPCLTFGGLSKVWRACGYRVGWLSLSGDRACTRELEHALDLLASLRLCSNVPAQWAVRPALEGERTIEALTRPGGRLHESRRAVLDAVARSRYLDVVAPGGALYAFPGVDRGRLPRFDDEAFALDLLERESVLVVPGSSFNVGYRNRMRVTLLPEAATITEVFARIERALGRLEAEAEPERDVA
jgi:alanine-synthesizing transaminase